ncbi:bifunctional diacylglycerol diphosphate phosphatase/phosphatidate phosphatase [Martiniozyma asiatica (nom. inval.)]|nr:bifunctional diacylglycerol diphosphate phosphatase/phosphatidate phosphatase [Martiniozyma asiatica]
MSFAKLHVSRRKVFSLPISDSFKKVVELYRFYDAAYVILVFLVDWFYFEKVHPYERQFMINDVTISHPFATEERVPGDVLLHLSTFLPIVILTTVSLVITPVGYKLYIAYISNLSYFVAMVTNVMVTDVLKNWIGRCRPDFLSRCKPIESAKPNVLYFAKEICSTYNPEGKEWGKLMDGFRTTPSGHSSMSFCMALFISLWLLGQFCAVQSFGNVYGSGHSNGIVNIQKRRSYSFGRILVCCSPLFGSAYVALSRTQDYRHHFVDVVLGSILGSFIAWSVYRKFWPSVTEAVSFIPATILEEDVLEAEEDEEWYSLAGKGKTDYALTGSLEEGLGGETYVRD